MSRKSIILRLALGSALVLATIALVLSSGDPLEPYLSRVPNPPPVLIHLQTNQGPLRVFPGHMGCLIILPDHSLWRWGQAGGFDFSRTNAPEPVTTNHDWVAASAGTANCVALSADGGVWTWGLNFSAPLVSTTPSGNWLTTPTPLGTDHEWVGATSGGGFAIVLKRDGTLWGWGHDSDGQLGNGLGPEQTNRVQIRSIRLPHVQTNLIQIGTERSWKAVRAEGPCTMALRADGTLWVWGRVDRLLNGAPGRVFATPTQVCRETNWLAFEWMGPHALAVNRTGELWQLFQASPRPSAAVGAVGQLFATNCVPGRFAFAGFSLCQLHPDGSLWETRLDVTPGQGYKPLNRWHRLGNRADWMELWSGDGTAYGLTAEGTLWTWGTAWGQEGITPFSSKVHQLENRIRAWFGAPAGPYSTGGFIAIQKEPRPLLTMMFETRTGE